MRHGSLVRLFQISIQKPELLISPAKGRHRFSLAEVIGIKLLQARPWIKGRVLRGQPFGPDELSNIDSAFEVSRVAATRAPVRQRLKQNRQTAWQLAEFLQSGGTDEPLPQRGERPQPANETLHLIAPIAAEKFIRAFPGQGHRDLRADEAAEHHHVQRSRIAERLIIIPDHRFEAVDQILGGGLVDVMFHPQMFGHGPGLFDLVEINLKPAVAKGKGFGGLRPQRLRSQGGQDRRINSAAEKHAHGNICDQLALHGRSQELPQLQWCGHLNAPAPPVARSVRSRCFGRPWFGGKERTRDGPPRLDIDLQEFAGPDLPDIPQDAVLAVAMAIHKKRTQPRRVHERFEARHLVKELRLGGKRQGTRIVLLPEI